MSKFKVYTKTGDSGYTSLIGPTRVRKDDLRVNAYGSVDELNSFIGLLAADLSNEFTLLQTDLERIQNFLFKIGADLATDKSKKDGNLQLDFLSNEIRFLENKMDEMDAVLPDLQQFILPAGSREAANAHCCRSISRRVERSLYAMNEQFSVNEGVLVYINRLSDFFFVLSRYFNVILKVEEKKCL